MTIKVENKEAMVFLSCTYTTERSKAVLAFATAQGLETGTVTLPNGDIHAAAALAQHIYCNAHEIGNPTDEENESYQIVSLLTALEMCAKGTWNYGTKLLYKLKCAAITLNRNEVAAFLAQEGTYGTNPNKGALMDGNMLSVSIYCGTLRALYNTLPGIGKGFSNPDSEPMKALLEAREESDLATIEKLARTYIPSLIGEENKNKVERFLRYLQKSDFYAAPISSRSTQSEAGGLAKHTVDTIYRMAGLLLPASDAQIGEIVMAGLCHDLCKVGVYTPNDEDAYYYIDTMPFGHGRKSMYMAQGYFEATMPENVASAIDAHMHDIDTNPNVGLQMMEQPLALFLHMADVLASHIDGMEEG